MHDPPPHEDDPPPADLDAGLRERLRYVRGGGRDLTHAELLELADALSRQRRDIAQALADLSRREGKAAKLREALEQASREAERALDERDAQLSALAAELEAERARLDERALAQDRSPAGFDAIVRELRERLDRVEAALAGRVHAQPPLQLDERLARAEQLVAELARVLHLPAEAAEEEAREAPPDSVDAEEERATGYVVFVATPGGYRLAERAEAVPALGEQLELESGVATVTGLCASPLPGDRRPCVVCVVDRLVS